VAICLGRISPERISHGRFRRQQHAVGSPYGGCHRGDMSDDHNHRSAIDDDLARSLLEQRTLVMSGVLDEAMGNRLSTGLLVLSARDPRTDIHLWINSPGGSVPAMLAIRDVMKLIPNDVSTLAMGIACSAGQFLLSAGTPGKRFALPHARVLLHQGSAGIGGTAMDIAIQADDLRHTRDTVLSLISQDTGQDVETVERDSRRDRWFSAQEALDYGFVDAVVSSIDEVQSVVRRPLGLGVGPK
jgi:ATP-dependent Clp protease protease subunit